MISSLLLQVLLLASITTANPLLSLASSSELKERDVCATYDYTEKIGDGAPKQIWLWKQLTVSLHTPYPQSLCFTQRLCGLVIRPTNKPTQTPLQCTKNECEVASSEDTSYEIGFSTNVAVPAFKWIDAGFSVARTITTGQSNTCTANKGQKVCVFEKVAHTEVRANPCPLIIFQVRETMLTVAVS
jgi:hypothetical protein